MASRPRIPLVRYRFGVAPLPKYGLISEQRVSHHGGGSSLFDLKHTHFYARAPHGWFSQVLIEGLAQAKARSTVSPVLS